MNQLTPAQVKVIETWTERRDSLLKEIGVHQTELNDLTKSTIEKGLALAELHKQIENARGRLSEITALEDRWRTSLSSDIAELEVRKTRLTAECELKEKAIKTSEEEQARISASIAVLCDAHDKMADQAQIVNKVVGEIIQTSTLHTSEVKTVMSEVRTISAEVISKSNENVKQTNIILEKLPKYIFELQRPIPIRQYSEARGKTQIDPDIIKEVKEHNAEVTGLKT